MHYVSFSLQDISHDWNKIQTQPSFTCMYPFTCQFSNAESYEYFMESRSLSFFHAFYELSLQIGASPTLFRSYEPQLLHFNVRYRQSFNVQSQYSTLLKSLHIMSLRDVFIHYDCLIIIEVKLMLIKLKHKYIKAKFLHMHLIGFIDVRFEFVTNGYLLFSTS